MTTNVKKIGEISIPVPWGQLAAKTWGEEKDPLILCFHGIMDNAGSFNRLIAQLPSTFYYVCIDLPGHGRSSSFPPHLPLHTLNFLLVYKHVTRYFKRKFVIMGHSYGGQLGFLYAQMYPECVEKLILLDTVTMYPIKSKDCMDFLDERIDSHLKICNKLNNKEAPVYTWEEALEKVQKGRNYSEIKRESAEALIERALEPQGELYKFTLDQRIKNFVNPLRDHRLAMEGMKVNPVKCPILMVLGNQNGFQLKVMEPVIKFLKKWKNVEFHMVEGNHDVHNDYPDRVSPFVNKFLLLPKGKL
ncbi:serine hydrolase-like protein isoform X2 [Diabrotica virgifera virgifera]|uniref:AB hydrolase-1 domain-containing protein n=2 Tax=Diabrotica virgifera virgifera TaxID=50390 RepID=A0ABM5IYD8_DIAVI|nr:serine hydrolase-like protein isoform X2 [Diabrotica virgifera virgifera]